MTKFVPFDTGFSEPVDFFDGFDQIEPVSLDDDDDIVFDDSEEIKAMKKIVDAENV